MITEGVGFILYPNTQYEVVGWTRLHPTKLNLPVDTSLFTSVLLVLLMRFSLKTFCLTHVFYTIA